MFNKLKNIFKKEVQKEVSKPVQKKAQPEKFDAKAHREKIKAMEFENASKK